MSFEPDEPALAEELTIPQVRAALWSVVRRLNALHYELGSLILQLHRRSPVTKAPIASRRMTAALRRAILAYHEAHPDRTQQHVATHFGVGAGRVSEALAGKRGRGPKRNQ